MPNMIRIASRWDGFPGSPGYTNLYGVDDLANTAAQAQAMYDRIHAFWLTVNGYLPSGVSIVVSPVYELVDEATGQIVSEGTVTTPGATITGNNAGNYAGNAGLAVNWQTDSYIGGRRLKGRTYFVPFTGIFENNGTLAQAAITDMVARVTALIGAQDMFLVWHRPINGAGGDAEFIRAGTVSDRAAHLASRSV